MNPQVQKLIDNFSDDAKRRFMEIRSLIFDLAEKNHLGDIEETLKWGQASYLIKSGSTIRVDWSEARPDSIELFFNCKTILVETFKEIFPVEFVYRGNRVIELPLNKAIPAELENCLLMAMNYHKLKKVPLLGA